MPISPGTRLGPYEITAPIGKGGMGEVYRARDTKLEREVAIKILPEEFAKDKERLARFDREAKLLASLNHPNIASIYGLEESDGVKALVLELVEGPTLAERIQEGPISVEETLTIAKQIAEALEAGHEAGVIHRDLKPANVKVKEDGTVKVLDYGLAKALEGDAPAATDTELSQSPTLARQGTQIGVILGTAAYMSPEQAKGKRVDRRTDIWAFGAVLYEMLTGKCAFEGDDVSDTLAAVLRAEPDFARLPSATPPALRRVLELCLAKDAKRRVHDIADVQLAVDGAFQTASEASAPAAVSRWTLPLIAAVGAGLVTGLVFRSLTRSEPPEVTRFAYELPEGQRLRNTSRPVLAVAPDGRRFVYNATGGLYLRSMDQLDARLLPGTEESITMVFFSPDGQSVAFQQNGQLKRLALSGGAPFVVCSVSRPFSGYWAADDTILFAETEGIFRVSANGGTPALVIPAADGEVLDTPYLLPGGDTVLFTVGTGAATSRAGSRDYARIAGVSLTSGERTVLLQGGSDARYVASGHLVYALNDGLFAVAFDARKLQVTSGPVSMVEGALVASASSSANYAVSDDGSLFFVAAGHDASNASMVWVDRTGKVEVIETMPPNAYAWPRLSPDGDRVLVLGDGDARVFELASGRQTRLTDDGASNYLGWTPSGKEVTYTSARGSFEGEIWIQPADGGGEARQLTSLGGRVDFDAWAPGGRTFSAHHHTGRGTNQLMAAFDGEDAELETWLEHDHSDNNALFSRDGRYVAFLSDQTGQWEVYIRPYPGPGGQTPVSVAGGTEPAWAPTGELFYRRTRDYMMMAVEVSTDPVLTVRAPVELFAGVGPGVGSSPTARYDVTADGQRFIMSADLMGSGEAGAGGGRRQQVIVVQNWVEELKKRVPTRN